jgi:hypothetical protein
VVALVGDDLGRSRGRRRQLEGFEVRRGDLEGRFEGPGVAGIARMNHGRENRAAIQIDRVLGLVGEPGAPVLQPRDPGLRVDRADPVGVRDPLAGAGAIELAQLIRASPLVRASAPSIACQPVPSVRRTIARMAAFASRVDASTPTRRPWTNPRAASSPSTSANTASWTSRGSRPRVRDSVL